MLTAQVCQKTRLLLILEGTCGNPQYPCPQNVGKNIQILFVLNYQIHDLLDLVAPYLVMPHQHQQQIFHFPECIDKLMVYR